MNYFHIYSNKKNKPYSIIPDDYLVNAEEIVLKLNKDSSSIVLSIQDHTFDYCGCPSVCKFPNCTGGQSPKELSGFSIFREESYLNEEEVKELFTDFQGMVIGYPYYTLSLYDFNNTNLGCCDLISIEKDNTDLLLNIIDLQNYNWPKKQLEIPCELRIVMTKKEGRILTHKGHLLNSQQLYTFFVKGVDIGSKYNLIGTTLFCESLDRLRPILKYLDVSITHDSNICHFYYSEIIKREYYHHIHHSSLDGDDCWWNITTRICWGDYKLRGIWNLGYIIKKLLNIATIEDVEFEEFSEAKIRFSFNKVISITELLKNTGILLSEMIEETQEYE